MSEVLRAMRCQAIAVLALGLASSVTAQTLKLPPHDFIVGGTLSQSLPVPRTKPASVLPIPLAKKGSLR